MAYFTMAESWKDFEARVLPPGAGEVQRIESRRAYYAGAQALFHGILDTLSAGSDATEQDLKAMDRINAELEQFGKDVKGGIA